MVQGQWEELPLQDPAAGAGGDEANWNPIEWDRAAEELTWERLLGLDGSLVSVDNSVSYLHKRCSGNLWNDNVLLLLATRMRV